MQRQWRLKLGLVLMAVALTAGCAGLGRDREAARQIAEQCPADLAFQFLAFPDLDILTFQ